MKKQIITVTYDPEGIPRVKINVGDVIYDLHSMLAKLHETNISVNTGLGDLSDEDKMVIHSIGFLLAATTVPNAVSAAKDAKVYADVVIAARALTMTTIYERYDNVKERETAYEKAVKKLTKDFDKEIKQ